MWKKEARRTRERKQGREEKGKARAGGVKKRGRRERGKGRTGSKEEDGGREGDEEEEREQWKTGLERRRK